MATTSVFDAVGMERVRHELRLDPEQVRRLRNALMKRFVADEVALARFAAPHRIQTHALRLDRRIDSTVDGASKLLLRTGYGLLTESVVLRIATGRSTVCVSSQIGCAAACRFCATGTMGIARSLSAEEILDQVLQGGQLLAAEGRRLNNVVFMGMGEPLHNEDAVYAALDALLHPTLFHLSPSKVMISTVGIIDGMARFAERFPRVGLALSLHSVRQSQRERLIPLAKHNPLPQLRETIAELGRAQSRRVMLEYLLLADWNDTADDLAALIDWTEGLDVHINVIPYNPIDGAPQLRGSSPEVRTAFAAALKAAGRRTTVRYSLGGDIAAACGQLVERDSARARSPRATLG